MYVRLNKIILIALLQIKPPKEWSPHVKTIPDDFIFEGIYEQTAVEFPKGGYDLDVKEHANMTAGEFRQYAREKHLAYYGEKEVPTIIEAEDMHWSELCKSKKLYAMNNSMSLFDEECKVWNLDQFTSNESLIHYKDTHHRHKVCIYIFNVFFLFDSIN